MSVIRGVPEYPGCVVASIATWSPIDGSGFGTLMICAPPPPMLNMMVSAPEFVFASRMAWRSEPAPESLVLTTE